MGPGAGPPGSECGGQLHSSQAAPLGSCASSALEAPGQKATLPGWPPGVPPSGELSARGSRHPVCGAGRGGGLGLPGRPEEWERRLVTGRGRAHGPHGQRPAAAQSGPRRRTPLWKLPVTYASQASPFPPKHRSHQNSKGFEVRLNLKTSERPPRARFPAGISGECGCASSEARTGTGARGSNTTFAPTGTPQSATRRGGSPGRGGGGAKRTTLRLQAPAPPAGAGWPSLATRSQRPHRPAVRSGALETHLSLSAWSRQKVYFF